MNKLDYAILNCLKCNGCFGALNSLSIKEILQEIKSKNATVYKKLMAMIDRGYVSNGIKDGRSNTYFITNAGLKELERAIKIEK